MNGKPSKYARRGGLFGLSRFHTKLPWVSGIGWMFYAMEIGLLSFVMCTVISHAIAANVCFLGEVTKGRSLKVIAATHAPQTTLMALTGET